MANEASLRADPVLEPFFDAGEHSFSAAAYVRSLLRTDSMHLDADGHAEQALRTMREKSALVDEAIKSLVSEHQEELFAAAGSTDVVKQQLADAESRAAVLSEAVRGLQEDIVKPYRELQGHAALLSNMLSASDVLSRTQRVLTAARKLSSLLTAPSSAPTPSSRDPAAPAFFPTDGSGSASAAGGGVTDRLGDSRVLLRAAPLIREVRAALADERVRGVHAVEGVRAWVASVAPAAVTQAQAMLSKSVASLNSMDVGTALQILADVGALTPAVRDALHTAAASIATAWGEALDVRAIATAASAAIDGGVGTAVKGKAGGALMPPAGAAAAWRGALWAKIETVGETTQRSLLQCWNLMYVLSHTHDASGKALLATALIVDGDPPDPCMALLGELWASVTDRLRRDFDVVAGVESAAFVRNTLTESYPRLHYVLLDILVRVSKSVALRASSEDASAAHRGHILTAASRTGSSAAAHVPVLPGTELFARACGVDALAAAPGSLLRMYLTRSFGRLTEATSAMFTGADSMSTRGATSGAIGSAPVDAHGFTPSAAMERYMDETFPEAPSQQATSAFIKIAQSEVLACRAPSAAAPASLSASTAAGGSGLRAADTSLLAAACKNVATACKLVAAKVEARAATSAGAVAVARHFTPTPAQSINFSLVTRCDDIRRALLRVLEELPLAPAVQAAADVTPSADVVVSRDVQPLAYPRSALAWAVQSKASAPSADALQQSPHAHLLMAVAALDGVVDAILQPWLGAVVAPLEATLLRMHDVTYTSLSAGGDAAPPLESEYVQQLDVACSRLASMQLTLLPAGYVADTIRAGLATRVLALFVRNACLIRPMDDTGRLRITKDAAQVEASIGHLCSDTGRIPRAFAELRALRPFLYLASATLLGAMETRDAASASSGDEDAVRRRKIHALLRTVRMHNGAHALLCRLPAACPLPFETARLRANQYSDWLDSLATAPAGEAALTSPALVKRDAATGWRRVFITDAGMQALDARVLTLVQACIEQYRERVGAQVGADAEAALHGTEMRLAVAYTVAAAQAVTTGAPFFGSTASNGPAGLQSPMR